MDSVDQSDSRRPPASTELLAILNITPDSFSPGTAYYERQLPKIDEVLERVRCGASIIDLGAEAMCPGSKRISPEEERDRLGMVLHHLLLRREESREQFKISIDTRNPSTAVWAIDLGADIINDVSALAEGGMKEVAATHTNVPFILMHNLGTPPEKHVTVPTHQDVVEVVLEWGREKLRELMEAGIEKERLVFDPGIAFGKTAIQSLDLIYRARAFHTLGVPICYGHSRKTYVVPYDDQSVEQRDGFTAGFSHYLATEGVKYLRVHDVGKNHEAVRGNGNNLLPQGWYERFREGLVERSKRRRAMTVST